MRLLTFILSVICLWLIVVLAVHQEIERLKTGYRMGRLIQERDRLRLAITQVEARMAALKAPGRLASLAERMDLGLQPLPAGLMTVVPETSSSELSQLDDSTATFRRRER